MEITIEEGKQLENTLCQILKTYVVAHRKYYDYKSQRALENITGENGMAWIEEDGTVTLIKTIHTSIKDIVNNK